MAPLIFGHKKSYTELQVDLGDLENEKEHLSSFLQKNLNLEATDASAQNKLTVKSEDLSAQELRRVVTKFVYHRKLNITHWVSTEETTIKINRFKRTAKKTEKHKRSAPHQTEIQSWGI